MVPSVRRLAPQILIAGVLPVIGYSVLRPHVGSDATALAAVMIFPVADILIERRRHGQIEPIGIISLIGIVVGLIGAVALHGNATLLKIRESMLTGLFGVVCLASLFAARPVMFYLGRAFATGGDPEKVTEFDSMWQSPGAPRRFKTVTAVWGFGLLGEAVLRTVLALTISTQRFLEIAPIIGWVTIGALLWYSTMSIRAGERAASAEDASGALGTDTPAAAPPPQPLP
jgi:membrane-bound ClpP family serine protease